MIPHNIVGLRAKYAKIPDERFFAEIFDKHEYVEVLKRPTHIVIDIGALAGEFSAYIYEKADIIYALEPFPAYWWELTRNIEDFGLEKIRPYQLAIGEENGVGKLSTGVSRGANTFLIEEGESIEVPVMTLAQFIKSEMIYHVDILKIDIEGYEEKVFNAPDFVTVAPLIDCIIGEHLEYAKPYLIATGFKMRSSGHNYIFER